MEAGEHDELLMPSGPATHMPSNALGSSVNQAKHESDTINTKVGLEGDERLAINRSAPRYQQRAIGLQPNGTSEYLDTSLSGCFSLMVSQLGENQMRSLPLPSLEDHATSSHVRGILCSPAKPHKAIFNFGCVCARAKAQRWT